MLKKLLSILAIVVLGILGYQRYSMINTKNESLIDSLESVKASYESVRDSLFFLRDSVETATTREVSEVTKYKVIQSIRYITMNTEIDSIQTMVIPGDTDTVAVFREKDLVEINKVIAENKGLTESLRISDLIIGNLTSELAVTDSILVLKNIELKATRRKSFLKGAAGGAILASMIWILF